LLQLLMLLLLSTGLLLRLLVLLLLSTGLLLRLLVLLLCEGVSWLCGALSSHPPLSEQDCV
jgi:hypothetical protein